MYTSKSENEINQLHQILIDRKSPEYRDFGEFLEQFAVNSADVLDSISGSGLLSRGETITTYVGFSLRILSSLLKLTTICANSEEKTRLHSVLVLIELISLITLTFLTIILDMITAAIIGIVLACYFLAKDIKSLVELLISVVETYQFNQWMKQIIDNRNLNTPLLDTQDPQFIEQLFFRQILLERSLKQQPNAEMQNTLDAIQQVTKQIEPPQSFALLGQLYRSMDDHFLKLQPLIHNWHLKADDETLDKIEQHQQEIITANQTIKTHLATYNQFNLVIDAQNNEVLLNLAEVSLGLFISIAGIALAILAFLLCSNLIFISTPLLYIAPLVLGITMVALTVSYLITNYVFTVQEEQHEELEILEKANSAKYCTSDTADIYKLMNPSNFF